MGHQILLFICLFQYSVSHERRAVGQKNRRKIWWHLERQSFAYLSAASRFVARISPTYLYARFESTMTATPSACLYKKKVSRRNWGSLFYILLNSGIRVMCVMTGNMTKRNENVNAH